MAASRPPVVVVECVTVLSIKPYSGYYHYCLNCTGKLREVEHRTDTDARWCFWCRRCSQHYDYNEVTQRYCVAVTVADQTSATCTEVVLFGETLNDIFGLPASQLHWHLHQRYASASEDGASLVRKALECVLVGKCASITFPPRQFVAMESSAPMTLAKLRRRDCGTPSARVIASGMKLLGNKASTCTVVAFLRNNFSPGDENDSKQSASCALSSQISDTSTFFGEPLPEERSLTFQLESYCEQSTLQTITLSSATSTANAVMSPSTLNRVVSPHEKSVSHLRSIIHVPSSESTSKCEHNVETSLGHSENSSSYGEHIAPSETAASPSNEWTHNNETILEELLANWESSQGVSGLHDGNASHCELDESELQFSEDVLKELQQNFDPSPLVGLPTQRLNDTSCRLYSEECNYGSPELFSSVPNSASSSSRSMSSPELFGSSVDRTTPDPASYKQPHSQLSKGFSHDVVTPLIQRSSKHPLAKRTLLRSAVSHVRTPHQHHHCLELSRSGGRTSAYSTPTEQGNRTTCTTSHFTPDLF